MSNIGYSSNVEEIVARLQRKDKQLYNDAQIGLEKGLHQFESKLIREQLTGRPGLRVQTGTARRSWNVRTKRLGTNVVGILSTSAWYLKVHQQGAIITARRKRAALTRRKATGVRRSVIPKRLFVLEDFKRSAPAIIKRQVMLSMFKGFLRRK